MPQKFPASLATFFKALLEGALAADSCSSAGIVFDGGGLCCCGR